MKYVREPVLRIDAEAIKRRMYDALSENEDALDLLVKSRIDVGSLLVQHDEFRWREWETRCAFADLLAAARTALAAVANEEPDPLSELRPLVYLHCELSDIELDEWRDLDRFCPPESTNPDPDRKEAPPN